MRCSADENAAFGRGRMWLLAKDRGAFGQYRRSNLGAFPSPLWGGVRGGGSALLSQVAPSFSHRTTPLPTPPPQGGREQIECGEGAHRVHGNGIAQDRLGGPDEIDHVGLVRPRREADGGGAGGRKRLRNLAG